ncbi:hypothetical protein DVH24_004936, partial [Malus domestica]
FEWPIEWLSAPGIPKIHRPVANSSCSGQEDCSFRGTKRVELVKNEIELNTYAIIFSIWPKRSSAW